MLLVIPPEQTFAITNLVLLFVVKIIAFLLGFATIRMGYILVRDGVTGKFKIKTEAHGYHAYLESGSPGLLFVALGIVFMCYAMMKSTDVTYGTSNKLTTTTTTQTEDKVRGGKSKGNSFLKKDSTNRKDTDKLKVDTNGQ